MPKSAAVHAVTAKNTLTVAESAQISSPSSCNGEKHAYSTESAKITCLGTP
ncbi:hypothetical protein [Paenibacillus sp. Soil766]|uniref:hypothetical protein n=1 Tax=Paenibacillus sp. Soil766 TaxID=1736404 RepID=UPI001F17E465|nr:hypothetical protein [Paenibacillus sp. Soil766]